ncbi:hypothetical protein ACLOJK_010136 [Asimina triloba]
MDELETKSARKSTKAHQVVFESEKKSKPRPIILVARKADKIPRTKETGKRKAPAGRKKVGDERREEEERQSNCHVIQTRVRISDALYRHVYTELMVVVELAVDIRACHLFIPRHLRRTRVPFPSNLRVSREPAHLLVM